MSARATGAQPATTNLSDLEDEELFLLAKEERDQGAEDFVILRYCKAVECLAARWAKLAGLSEADVADAKQIALLALVMAARVFKPARVGQPCLPQTAGGNGGTELFLSQRRSFPCFHLD